VQPNTSRALVIVAKAPAPGLPKTRLARQIGPSRTLALYEAFLRDTLDNCHRVEGAVPCLCFTPPDSRGWFSRLSPAAPLFPQPEAPFGARLAAAFQDAFEAGFQEVILIGTDTPHLTPEAIGEAFEAMADGQVVIGPCRDGGWYLMGLHAARPELFEGIDWSTSRTLQQTLARARQLGLQPRLLPETFDVDDLSGLELLRHHLVSAAPSPCPRTSQLLEP